MKYFEKISFSKEENKDLLTGTLAGIGISTGITGIETSHRYSSPSFKNFMEVAKKRKIPIMAIIGGSALLKAGIGKMKAGD